MENEDEEASKLTNPVVHVEDDSMHVTTAATITTTATVTDSHEAVQEKTEPQCEPETVAELSESQLPQQSLGERKEIEEEEIVGNSEAVAEVDESKLGGGGDESRDSELVVSKVVGEDDGDAANAEDVVKGADLVVPVPVVSGSEGEKKDVVGEGEREAADRVEETEGKTRMDDAAEEKEDKVDAAEEKEDKADAAEEKEIVGELKGDDLALEAQTENETKVDDVAEEKKIVGEQKGDDVAVEAQTENETKVDDGAQVKEIVVEQKGDNVAVEAQIENETMVDDVAEETCIAEDMIDERTEMAGDRDVAGDTKVVDVVEETVTADETNTVDVAEETDTADETNAVDVAEETETADETKAVDVAEETETVDETKAFDVAVEMDGRAEMAEDSEIAGETKVVDVAEDKGMAKEINLASAEVTKVADVTQMTVAAAADEMEVSNVAEETEMQEEEKEFADMTGGETEVEEEAEMLEVTETEEIEMGDVGEETMEAGADVGDEMEKAETAEEMETGEGVEEVNKTVGGKRKRVGKNSKSPGKAPSRKKSEEDVCFICFDGGDLVLCDRRGCPKAYHPSCVNRDEAFFRAKGRWNCGWHLCSICEKNAYYMCYTCTFSLCKGCIKDAVIFCVRGNKGFCETCMKTVMLIEKKEQGNKEPDQVDFDDKSSWEYLFKDYWLDLKGRLSLSADELGHAKNPWKGSDIHAGKQDFPDDLYDANVDGGHGSDSSSGNAEATVAKRRKAKKRSKSRAKDEDSSRTVKVTGGEGACRDGSGEWASKELLELVMHMRNGDKSVLSQFDVQTLLLEYIKKYKLRDPQRRTHVICDARLQNLFGKPRVGHFEMLKLLESHFLTKEDSQVDELQGSVVDTEANQLEADGNADALAKGGKDKKRKTRKKGDHRGLQSNLDDFAAIDKHNINLIYLRRNLVEELLEDAETFHDKVVGTFARIRISGSVQKQDLYRLVQVTGTSKGAEPYKVGKRMTDIMLEILNLNKKEVISVDIISNQEFTEDECKRLRQSIKCGLINRLTVGDIQEKAMALQEVRVKDWMEAEILRLSHLRDRASDLGRRKELRECVEKLQLLKTPEERQRRLEEIPEIHSDPNMDPSYESEEDDGETDDKRQENYMRLRGSGFNRRGREPISPGRGGSFSNDSLSGTRNYSGGSKELTRNMSNKGFLNKGDDFVGGGEIVNDSLSNPARDRETGARNPHSVVLSESISRAVSENSPASASTGITQSAAKINESEKIWHYQDPSGKVQGPFSMVQLRKWNNTGYFPANLRIWRSNEKQDDSILLTDALAGEFYKYAPLVDSNLTPTVSYPGKPHGAPLHQGMEAQVGGNSNFDQNRIAWNQQGTLGSSGQSVGGNWKLQPEISSTGGAAPSLELPKQFRDGWGGSETNLPSPTPTQSTAGETRGKTFEKEWSPTPINQSGSHMMTNHFLGGNGGKQSPNVVGSETGQLAHFSTPSSASKSSNVDGVNVTHGVTSATKPETGESHRVLVSPLQLPASDSVVASMTPPVDIKNIGATLQSLVQSVSTHIAPVEGHGWGSGLAARPEMMTPSPKPVSVSQGWGSASSQKLEPNNPVSMPAQSPAYAQPYASPFNTGNSPGLFPASGQSGMPASDSWRPPVPSQSNVQPPAQPINPWGMGIAGNQSAVPRQGPENQNTGWGQMPGNPGWVGQLPASTNMNWGAPVNTHAVWAGPTQVQAPKNAIPGWAPPGQGPPPVNANPGWVAPAQVPQPGNGNPGWGAPTGNPGMWSGEQNNGGDRFSSQTDRGSHGGDSGYGGGRPWNRQSSFGSRGGDSSRPHFNKGQRVCKFHESGHCKKGSQCDYLHT